MNDSCQYRESDVFNINGSGIFTWMQVHGFDLDHNKILLLCNNKKGGGLNVLHMSSNDK